VILKIIPLASPSSAFVIVPTLPSVRGRITAFLTPALDEAARLSIFNFEDRGRSLNLQAPRFPFDSAPISPRYDSFFASLQQSPYVVDKMGAIKNPKVDATDLKKLADAQAASCSSSMSTTPTNTRASSSTPSPTKVVFGCKRVTLLSNH
jgi:hypothetical protein